jgi:ppGpp synthetase/RelA/SpoT-type nucleotidyltranferase
MYLRSGICRRFHSVIANIHREIQRVVKMLAIVSAVSIEDFGMEQASSALWISKPAGYQSVHTTDPNTQYPVIM